MALCGHLHLEAAPAGGGRSVLSRQSFSPPFHVGKGYEDRGVLRVQVVNPTAGILEGDEMEMRLRVRAGATLGVTTPSASRCFRMAGPGRARLLQHLEVEAGGCLEYSPEPLYPHAGSDFEQLTRVSLERGASLFLVDSLAPGRAARGELWAWRRLVMALQLELDGLPFLQERLDCSGEDMRALAAFHARSEAWLATVLVACARPPAGETWRSWLPAAAPGAEFACTELGGGIFVARAIAGTSQGLREAVAGVRGAFVAAMPWLAGSPRRL